MADHAVEDLQQDLLVALGEVLDELQALEELPLGALAGGGGVLFQVAYGRTPVWIDGGLRYQGHGRTRYLREGSLDTDNNGNVVLSPIESETNMLVMHLGVQVGF